MKKIRYHIVSLGLAITLLVCSSCEKLVEIDAPLNEVSTASVFSSDKLATSALSAMYSYFSQSSIQSNNLTLYSALQSDDLLYLSTVAGMQEINNNTYSIVSTSHATIFSEWYASIYRANAIIEGLQKYNGTSDRVKKQLTAEAKFMRAYCHFNLLNQFGAVPLILTTDVNVTAMLPRETPENVYRQIIADLIDAKANLLADYSATANDRIGVNKFTAAALLARVYLFTGDYASAETNASEVISSPLYSLIPSANMGTGVFVKNSAESIFQLVPPINPTNQYNNEAATFIPSAYTQASIVYRLTPDLIQKFTSTDLRRTRWMVDANIAGTTYTVPAKYKYRTNALAVAAGVSENISVFRLAEQYLIRAEARARIGTNLAGSLSDLNAIRTRAAVTASTANTASTLLDEIALENRREFFCEQGFRWFNLKRTGQADAVLGALKTSYRPASKLFPIPQAAIDANPNLTQNPGY